MWRHRDNPKKSGQPEIENRSKKNPWIILLKVVCWCVGGLVVLAGIAIWIIGYHLSPQRITKLIEEKSSEYLKADIKIGKLDYKLFRTYPWFEFEIDSLTVISKSLEGISAEQKSLLPRNADSLAFIRILKGGVNVHGLLHDEIILRGIEIGQPKVNIVMVNDSVTNFNIAKRMPKTKKLPQLDISEIKIRPDIKLGFFSLQDSVNAKAEMESFYLAKSSHRTYDISLEGIVDGSYGNYKLPASVPVKMKSGVRWDLPSFSVKLYDLSLAVAGLSLDAKGEISADKAGMELQQADFNIKIDDLFGLLAYLPEQFRVKIPLPEGLSGNVPIDIHISVPSSYNFNKESLNNITLYNLPPLYGSVKVEDANISFSPPGEKRIEADDIYFEALCNFNPRIPEETTLQVKEIRMHGEGISFSGNASCDNLLGENQGFEGKFFFSSPLMKTLSYFLPGATNKITGLLKGNVEFSGKAKNLGKEGLIDLAVSGDITSRSLTLKTSSVENVRLKNFKSDYKAIIPSYPLNNYAGTKMALDINADSIVAKNSGMDIYLSSLKLILDAIDTVSGTPDPYGSLSLKAGGMKLLQGSMLFNAQNINLNAAGELNSTGASGGNYAQAQATATGDDALLQQRVAHTPLTLVYDGGGILQTLMNLLNLNADITIEKGDFKSPDYLYPVEFEGVDISSNLDNMQFSAKEIDLSGTSFSISGVMEGIKPFMTTYSATPLKATADINFKNVDINQLSWGYYGSMIQHGENKDSVFYVPAMTPFTAADSVAVMIPRNVEANINLRASSAEYLQYRFSPLSTNIYVKNGEATLSNLTIGAPYCTAVVDWTYSTTRLDNIFMNLKADVENFNFSPFYIVFPSLVEKTPELKNFTGLINANIDCRFLMFPDMFMNAESLKAEFDIKGSDMEFARQGKIEKITHLMLIEGEEPIKIQNMDITGDYHDNLLQINPFKVRFDGYELEVGGINNTAGDMYYHLALEKSPFHLPFGVSLSGKFRHPEVNLGGTRFNNYRAEMVPLEPASKINVNIMAYLKHGWLLFVQEAAKYEGGIK